MGTRQRGIDKSGISWRLLHGRWQSLTRRRLSRRLGFDDGSGFQFRLRPRQHHGGPHADRGVDRYRLARSYPVWLVQVGVVNDLRHRVGATELRCLHHSRARSCRGLSVPGHGLSTHRHDLHGLVEHQSNGAPVLETVKPFGLLRCDISGIDLARTVDGRKRSAIGQLGAQVLLECHAHNAGIGGRGLFL